MAKPEAAPENGTVPEKKDKPSVRPFNGAENAKKFKEGWTKLKGNESKARVSVPGSKRSVEFTRVETDDKKLSIWTTSDVDGNPDFVVVNPPTEIVNSAGALVEDPLTAIALIIDGATK